MLLKCLVIEEDAVDRQHLATFIARVPSLELIKTFNDISSAGDFVRKHPVPLIFIDVQLTDSNKINFVRGFSANPMIIFTGSNKRFPIDGFELDAVDFLIKPFDFERFCKAVSKAEEFYKYKSSLRSQDKYLYVYSEYKQLRINLKDIEFIEALEDYVRIHTTTGKPILTLTPLKKIIQQLPSEKFQRVHRCYVVSIAKIKSFATRKVTLENAEVPVSDSYMEAVKKLRRT